MFIINVDKVANNCIVCDESLAKHLMSKNFPLLSRQENKYFFTKSKEILKEINGGE